jgi:endonuclease/exonuclease/phosphatase (EEP) superfamily protein YafD
MKKKLILISLIVGPLLVFISFFSIFQRPTTLELMSIAKPETEMTSHISVPLPESCIMQSGSEPIDNRGSIHLLVWNIYKEQRSNWSSGLTGYSEGQQILAIQESHLIDEFSSWIRKRRLSATLVNAFSLFGAATGVMTVARENPISSCGDTELEPLIRLSKSSLVSYFPLSDGKTLALVNIHMVNFTVGAEAYRHQLDWVLQRVYEHHGPLLVVGDFNSWSDSRIAELKEFTESLGLAEVEYIPDNRKRFFYNHYPLDHVFYRDLKFLRASVPLTTASDHNPIIASFSLN